MAAIAILSKSPSKLERRFDPRHEPPLTLRAACKLKVLHRDGKAPHLATLYRWATRGVRGQRLETLVIGGAMVTSEASVLRMIRALSGDESALPVANDKQREDAIRAAERELAEE